MNNNNLQCNEEQMEMNELINRKTKITTRRDCRKQHGKDFFTSQCLGYHERKTSIADNDETRNELNSTEILNEKAIADLAEVKQQLNSRNTNELKEKPRRNQQRGKRRKVE